MRAYFRLNSMGCSLFTSNIKQAISELDQRWKGEVMWTAVTDPLPALWLLLQAPNTTYSSVILLELTLTLHNVVYRLVNRVVFV